MYIEKPDEKSSVNCTTQLYYLKRLIYWILFFCTWKRIDQQKRDSTCHGAESCFHWSRLYRDWQTMNWMNYSCICQPVLVKQLF